ncbi:MAG: phycobilisome protein [Leptolyngbyaceae bacterium]|nr:phycobilisome protein [Leptolyngbyaceae bacterium]
MSTSSLSDRAKELISKARIVSFDGWATTHPPALVQRFQQADDQQYYLTDEDMVEIVATAPATAQFLSVVLVLRDRAPDIVNEARSAVLVQFPNILEPGGGLYPPARAEACWRDFWHFLRCITYGIAGQHLDYTSAPGLHYMNLLYQELQVPLDAMVVGLEGVKAAALSRVEDRDLHPSLAPYFDQLIDQLRQFEGQFEAN